MAVRLLTQSEKDYIVSGISLNLGIPEDTKKCVCDNIKSDILTQLETLKVNENGIEELKHQIDLNFHQSQVQPGEMVGILTAQSIGERQTQMTLNTFHSAGLAIKTVVTGVPKFTELLNATKDPKASSAQIYFKGDCSTIQKTRDIIGHNFKELKLSDLIESYTIYDNNTPKEDEFWYSTFKELEDIDIPEEYEGCISLKIRKDVIFEYNLPLSVIIEKITDEYTDIQSIYSPTSIAQIDLFMDTSSINLEDRENIMYINEGNMIKIYLEEVVLPVINNIHIAGIPRIKEIYYKQEGDQWTIETEGTNLEQILAQKCVDEYNTCSDSMWEIYKCFGIEAARQFLIDEFMNVVSSDGTYINERHVTILVDIMTTNGNIMSVSRYGMKKGDMGALAKASFEESIDNFLKAGVFGEIESTNGVSASIMCGKRSRVGTGLCDLVMDKVRYPAHHTVYKGPVKENFVSNLSYTEEKIYQDDDKVNVIEDYDDGDSSEIPFDE